MNRKIPFHDFAAIIASKGGIGREDAEKFAKSFFELIEQTLVNGDSVKIKGLGTFSPTGDNDAPVEYIPDTELADTVNAPFALFEAVEIGDDVSDATLAAAVDIPQTENPDLQPEPEVLPVAQTVAVEPASEEPVSEPVGDPEQEEKHVSTDEAKPENEEESKPEPETEQTVEAEPLQVIEPVADDPEPTSEAAPTPDVQQISSTMPVIDDEPEMYVAEEPTTGHGFGWGFVTGLIVGLALGACVIYFALDYIYPTGRAKTADEVEEVAETISEMPDSVVTNLATQVDTTVIETPAAATDTVPAAEQTPDPKPLAETPAPVVNKPATPVTDTVRAGYLINSMAKKHYGNKCFWVYIYEENKSKIKNPNRVNAGTVLVIPPAEKYGIDASNPASVAAANKKIAEVLSKFPN